LARCAPPESLHRLLDLQPSAHGQPHELRRTLRSVAAGKEPALRSPLTTALTRRQALLRPHLRGTGVAPTERDRPHPHPEQRSEVEVACGSASFASAPRKSQWRKAQGT